MSFIPDYLAAGIDEPDFDLRVIPIFQFPDERQCLEWFGKAQEARRAGLSLTQSGLMLDDKQRRGVVAAITGQPLALDPRAKLSVGIDTSRYRVPGFLLARAVAGCSLNDAIRVASESYPRMSEATIGRLWRDHMPIAHFGGLLLWCRRDFLRRCRRGLCGNGLSGSSPAW